MKIKALALLESGLNADAVALLRRVLDEYPDSLDAAYCAERLGAYYLAVGNASAAEQHYRRSLALRPDQNATSGEVHIGLAEALTAQERYEDALQALELVPPTRLTLNHSVSRWNAALAEAALGVGEQQLARDAAKRALALLDSADQFSRHPGVGRAVLTDAQRRRLEAIERGDRPSGGRRWPLRRG
jgi:tetratricopeptide (TPR) repeat protein